MDNTALNCVLLWYNFIKINHLIIQKLILFSNKNSDKSI